MKSPNIRQNFYQGQNILAKDLNALQDYSDTNKNLLVSELLGSGILHGFEITKKEGFTISISPGVAFDKNGTRLILEELTDITLTPPTTAVTDKRLKPILLGIKLSYNGSEPIKDSLDNETPTRFTPSVEIITGENLDEEVFQLASITLDESAITAITTIKNKFAYHQHIKDLIYPINYQYTQYPDKATGLFREENSPLALFGGDWELVETSIKNNVATEHPDKTLGIMKLFPDRTAIFTSNIEGLKNSTIITYPVPFISKLSSSFATVDGISIYTQIDNSTFVGGSVGLTSVDIQNDTTSSNRKTICSITGYWKNPTDPISAEEEKNYVKIWQRI